MMAQNMPLEVDVKQKAQKRSAQSPFLREAFSFLLQGRGGHLFSESMVPVLTLVGAPLVLWSVSLSELL